MRVTNDMLETDEPDEGEPDREDTHLVSVFVSAARIATASESAS